MSKPEIISMYLLIECKEKYLNFDYPPIKANFLNLVNYVECFDIGRIHSNPKIR